MKALVQFMILRDFCVFVSRFDWEGGGPRRVRGLGWSSCQDREEASRQVRDDPKSGGLACICTCSL